MGDRELLELAAKAAGLSGQWTTTIGGWDALAVDGSPFRLWQPLYDDGDALRLAVKLRLVVDTSTGEDMHVQYPVGCAYLPLTEEDERDPYAATRRAVVRAAAAMAQQAERKRDSAHPPTPEGER